MKNETLEEAAERIYPRLINDPYNPQEDDNEEDRNTWISGAKWAQERSYSEEEVINIFFLGRESLNNALVTKEEALSVIRKFKNK